MNYYNVGKLFSDAGKHYGEGIIKEYSKKLTEEAKKKLKNHNYCDFFFNFFM